VAPIGRCITYMYSHATPKLPQGPFEPTFISVLLGTHPCRVTLVGCHYVMPCLQLPSQLNPLMHKAAKMVTQNNRVRRHTGLTRGF